MIHGLLLAAALCAPQAFRADGIRSHAELRGPGLVLSGGGLSEMPDEIVLAWMRARIGVPGTARAGNLLILKASGERYYTDAFYRESRFAYVQEILIPPCATRAQVDAIAPYADRADAVLFAGGDQAHYAAWKGSKLIAAVRRVYARGGIVGGGSAGLAIQGEVVFDSVAADRILPDDEDVATPDAVKNPYEPAISFTTGFFDWPPMRDTITDTHVARRNRFGRLTAFMARAVGDRLVRGSHIFGVAVDEGAALLVDARGNARLVERPREDDGYAPQGAWIVQGGAAQRLRPGVPLRYTVQVTHLTAGMTYDLAAKRAMGGGSYRVTVDGAAKQMYSRNPYLPKGE
jgi:cyanophycinase-like exopeptidase